MKKLLLIIATAVVAVSCCSRPTGMHFDTSTGRAYYDETVEMDTLSYSMAMNVALGIRFQPMGNDIDADLLVGAMLEEVQKEVVDVDFLQANREKLNQFSEERLHNSYYLQVFLYHCYKVFLLRFLLIYFFPPPY